MATKRAAPQLEERISTRFRRDDLAWLGERAKALRLTVSDVVRMVVWKARMHGETFSDLGPDPEAARKGGAV